MQDVERRWTKGEVGSFVERCPWRPPPVPVVGVHEGMVLLHGPGAELHKFNPGQARWLAMRLLEAVLLLEMEQK
jgi:hypothetical protein